MGTKFWVKRFLTVLSGAFIIIFVAQWLKGNTLNYAITQGAIWSFIAASIFTAGRYYNSSKGQHCAICKDTPEINNNEVK